MGDAAHTAARFISKTARPVGVGLLQDKSPIELSEGVSEYIKRPMEQRLTLFPEDGQLRLLRGREEQKKKKIHTPVQAQTSKAAQCAYSSAYRAEKKIHRQQKHDKVQHRGRHGMANVEAENLGEIGRCKGPAVTARLGHVPHVGGRRAGHPGEKGVD